MIIANDTFRQTSANHPIPLHPSAVGLKPLSATDLPAERCKRSYPLCDSYGHPLRPESHFATFVWPRGIKQRLRIEQERFNERDGQPLAIIAPEGLGKTHLLQALAASACHQGLQVLLIDIPRMIEEAAPDAAPNEIPSKIRDNILPCDMLLIDNLDRAPLGLRAELVDFIAERLKKGLRTVITLRTEAILADPSLDIVASHFVSANRVTIPPLSYEHRIRILRSKATALGAEVPERTFLRYAQRPRASVRDLEKDVESFRPFRDFWH